MLIGHWHDGDDRYSHPQPLVDHEWERMRRPQLVAYLKDGYAFAAGGGYSYCRFGCTQQIWFPTDDPNKAEYFEFASSRVGLEGGSQIDPSGYYIRSVIPLLNGCYFYCDDEWCWPEGLAHYVEAHGIRLPDEFVAHAAGRGFRAVAEVEGLRIEPDDRFWREWCATNAPFDREPHCRACRSPDC